MTTRRPLLVAAVVCVILLSASFARPFDRLSEDYLDTALRNALATFAIARLLNAGISVVQATDVSFSPAGVGVTLAPGEVLDPLNDLVERFSWVMLAAATSLGIQKLLLSIGASEQFSLLLALALLGFLLALWRARSRRTVHALFCIAAVLVAVRFAMALMLLANHLVYEQFIEPDYREAAAGLEQAKQRIEALELEQGLEAQAPAAEGESFMGSVKNLWSGAAESLNPARHLRELRAMAAEATDHVIRLIVIFVLQTILLPLLFLWALYKTVAALLRRPRLPFRPRPE